MKNLKLNFSCMTPCAVLHRLVTFLPLFLLFLSSCFPLTFLAQASTVSVKQGQPLLIIRWNITKELQDRVRQTWATKTTPKHLLP